MEIGRNEALQLIALEILAEAGEPVGSMRLSEAFQQAGYDLAQATAGRFLQHTDMLGLTAGEGGKRGRVITGKGLVRLEELRVKATQREKSLRLMDAVTISDLSELRELLFVRRAVESEGARLAATRGTRAELARIMELARSHVRDVSDHRVPTAECSLQFHRSIAEASHNSVLMSVASVLFESANSMLMDVMEIVSVNSSNVALFADEHFQLAQALADRDAKRAHELMYAHITDMIAPVEQSLADDEAGLRARPQ